MELQYTDDKRKLFSKKGSRNSSSRRAAAGEGGGGGALLRKSASAREVGRDRSSFSNRCANAAKEQRARFYIVRRCVTMLVCWRDYP